MSQKHWRPPKWSPPFLPKFEFDAYEEGADAILESLRPLITRLSNKAESLPEADYLVVREILED